MCSPLPAPSYTSHCATVRRSGHLFRHLRHTPTVDSWQYHRNPCHTKSPGSPVLTAAHIQCLWDHGIFKKLSKEIWAFLSFCLLSRSTPPFREMLKSVRRCFLLEFLQEADALSVLPRAQGRSKTLSVLLLENGCKNTALHLSTLTDKKSWNTINN